MRTRSAVQVQKQIVFFDLASSPPGHWVRPVDWTSRYTRLLIYQSSLRLHKLGHEPQRLFLLRTDDQRPYF